MTKQMTPLRRRMIDDMTIRNMSPSIQYGSLRFFAWAKSPAGPARAF